MWFKNVLSSTSSDVPDCGTCSFNPIGKRRWRRSMCCAICERTSYLVRVIKCDACRRSAHYRCAVKKFVADHRNGQELVHRLVAGAKDVASGPREVATKDVACGPDRRVQLMAFMTTASVRNKSFADRASQTNVAISDATFGDDKVMENGASSNPVAISHAESGEKSTGDNAVDVDASAKLVLALSATPFRPSNHCRFAVASGHVQQVRRLRFVVSITSQFGPGIERVLLSATATRVVAPAAAHLAVRVPWTVLMQLSAFACKTVMPPVDEDYVDKQLVALPVLAQRALSLPRRPRSTDRVAVAASGHEQQLRLLFVCVTRAFGPDIERVLFAATFHRNVAPAITNATMAPLASLPSVVQVTAFDCLNMVRNSMSNEKKKLRAKAQRLKMAPTPLVVKSELTRLG